MDQYDVFAHFYDAVNGEPEELISRILDYTRRYAPLAESVLELGCGTGAVLAGLGSGLELTGVDRSATMLDYARRRLPAARLVHGDITTLDLERRFDVVVCVFDTLNHVTTAEGWRRVMATAASHLAPGGIFIFDLNTVGRLRELSDNAAWVYDFDGHTLIMDVDFRNEPLAEWDIRIFENRGDSFRLHHEVIVELGLALEEVRELLATHFDILDQSDPLGARATDHSERAYFCLRRR